MPEPVDVYADQFQINMGAYGCVLNFLLSGRDPVVPGAAQSADRVASIRMSLEHLKLMTFILRRQVTNYEQNAAVRIQLPQVVLNALQIGREDWNECWREG
jgi:hypothetical protein